MQIVYSKPKDLQTLARQLMSYSDLSETAAQQLASEGIHRKSDYLIPLQPKEDWPVLPEKEMRIINYRIRKIVQAISEAYPLLLGETINEDGYFATYLSKDYINYPKGTVAVQRTTSFGELVFFDNNFVVRDKAIQGDHRPIVPALEVFNKARAGEPFSWGGLAVDIAKSLASSIAGKIGSSIFDELFPAGVPSYFDTVYAQFEQIVNKSIAENKRKEMSASVAAIQDGMRTYNNLKKDPAKYEQCQKMLSDFWNESRLLINNIMVFNEVGLGLFAVAGGLHLSILQERAVTDRDHTDPNNSPWSQELNVKALEFANWAIERHNSTIWARGAAISEVRLIEKSYFVPNAGPIDESYYFWEDTIAGEKFKYNKRQGCCDPDPYTTSHADRQKRWNDTVVVMTNNLSPLMTACEYWRKIPTLPIPI